MVEFDMSVRFRLGPADEFSDSTDEQGKLKSFFTKTFGSIANFASFLKNDVDTNYRFTYEEGVDAYMILFDKKYPVGIYHNANNLKEYFYKTYDTNGNSIAAFVVPESAVMGTVQRMEGQQMAPTDIMQSTSMAEIFITNCYEANLDPYIPLKTTYSEKGIAFTWYGRNSKFTEIPGFVPEHSDALVLEQEYVNQWLDSYVEEEPDLIDLSAINRMNEIRAFNEQAKSVRKRRTKGVR